MSRRATRTPAAPTDHGAAAAARAENAARQARAEAEAAYYRNVGDTISSMPGQLAPDGGGRGGRTDTAWNAAELDVGNVRWQNPAELWRERQRARQLEGTNWLAAAVLDRVNERVIGTILTIEPQTKSKRFNKAAKEWLKGYWYTTGCDVRNRYTWSEYSHLFFRSHFRDGDALTVFTEDARGNPKMQMIEAHRLRTPANGPMIDAARARGNAVFEGIELDPYGAAVAYHVHTQAAGGVPLYTRLDARDCVYLGRTSRYGDVRCLPAFHGGYWLFDQVMGYLEAVVIAARVGACQAMIAHREDPGTAAAPNTLGNTRPNGSAGSAATGQQQRVLPITPGAINVMGLNEKLEAFNPTQPTANFPDAIDVFARFIGIRFGLTLEDVLLKFAGLSWSTSKASRNAAQAASAVLQEKFASQFITRSYQWALSKAVKNGSIATPPPASFWDHEWLPPVWQSVDPLKDIQAAKEAIALGVDCRSYVARSLNGYEFADVCVRNGLDQELMVDNGLSTAIAVGNSQAATPPGQQQKAAPGPAGKKPADGDDKPDDGGSEDDADE